ncbi:hypothetical protein M1B34_32360, partial [Pseudomonas sp. MAFF 302030]
GAAVLIFEVVPSSLYLVSLSAISAKRMAVPSVLIATNTISYIITFIFVAAFVVVIIHNIPHVYGLFL